MMNATAIIKIAIALPIMLTGIIGLSRELVRIWQNGVKFPRIWIDLMLGLLLAVPQILYSILVAVKMVPSSANLFSVFDTFTFLFVLVPGIVALAKPFHFDKSPAMYEVPLLFAICVSYSCFIFFDKAVKSGSGITFLLIFVMFCYDIFRISELGNYETQEVKERSRQKLLGAIGIWSTLYCGGWIWLKYLNESLSGSISDRLILLCINLCLEYLPYICLLGMMLRFSLPVTMFIRANIIRCIIICSLLLPLDMFYRWQLYTNLNPYSLLWDMLILLLLWFSIGSLKMINRKAGSVMLILFVMYLYVIIG